MDRKRNSRERDIDLESKRSRTQESRSPSFEYDEDITYYEDSRSPLSGQDHDYADTDFFPLAKGGGDGTDRKKRRYRVMADASKDERRTRDERKHRSDRSNRERRDQHQRSPQQHSSSSSRKSHVRPTASSEHISPHSFEAKRSQDWQNWDRSAPSHRYPDREGHRHVERVRHSREQHRGERRGSGPIVLRGHRYQREEEDMQRNLSPNRDEATHMRQRERRGEANICRSLSPFRTDYHSSRGRRLMKEDGKFVQRRSDSPLSEHLERRGRREHMRGRSRGNEERGILHRVESGSERSEGDGGVSDDGRCGDERLELRGESLDQFIKDLESNSSSSSEPEDRDMQHRKETVSHSDSSTGEVYSDNEDGHFQPHSQSQSQSRSRSQSHSQSPESGEGRHPHVMRSKFDSDDDGEEEEEEVSEEDPNLPPHEGYQETPPGEDRADLQHQQELKEEEEEAKKEEEAAENQKLSAKFSEELAMEDDEEEEKEGAVYLPQLMGCRNVESFEWLNRIEEGTYGVVHRAKDKKTGEIVALKKLKMENEKEGFPITSLREISTLLKARHPNIVHLKEVVVGSNMNKIFIVMEYVEHDLKALMETMIQPFLLGEVKTLMIQLLRAVHHLHDNWILHRDLKASNLLLSHKGILKVGDFGLAREYGSPLKPYTPIVVTLWYRAPELLLGTKEYSTAIDMWSVGCIFAEFLQKKPLFRGRSEIDQINLIFKELGTPNERIWPGYNKLPTVEKVTFTHHPYNNLRKKFPSSFLTENGFNLLNRFLTYDPKKRIVASESLDHQFFKEPPMPVPPSMFPTWPAKSEMTRGKRREKSPKPPEGAINLLVGDDDKVGPVGPSAAPAGPGFSLKF